MDTFSPEFSAFWLEESGQAQPVERRATRNDEGLSPSQQVALEELAERVNAARSVI
jgi:hypothetical protein